MVSDKFRHQLRQEAELWQAEGLIDAEQYQQLSERYQFNLLETVAHDRFITILVGVGSILLGLGVITFVAANWQAWSRELKVLLLLSLFIVVNAAGFYLWKRPIEKLPASRRQQQRLGRGLLLFGALILGANMALMAQMFHVNGSRYELFLAWGLGVLGMAYSLRLNSLGVLAILLTGLGYLQGVPELSVRGEFSWLRSILDHMPLLAGLMFVPLAYWCRSHAIFVLAAILVVTSLEFDLAAFPFNSSRGWREAIAFALPPALLWAYDDALWPNVSSSPFQPVARNLALLFLSVLFYIFSFHWFWEAASIQVNRKSLVWLPSIDVLLLIGFTILAWLYIARQATSRPTRHGIDLETKVIGCSIAIAAFVPLWHFSLSPIPAIATIIFNGLLFFIVGSLIRQGLMREKRSSFWGGIVLLALQIISRLLEYDTGLLFKSLIFLLCGVGVIAAGLWFERHLSASTPSKEHLL